MANELRGISSGGTLYARIINRAGLWWNGAAFEAYDAASYGDYDIPMTQQGATRVYVADFPAAIVAGGTYEYYIHRQAGGSPDEADLVVTTGKIDWTGSAVASAASGAMAAADFYAYVLGSGGFKRTDKSTEFYEACTDAIQEMRRRFGFDEAEVDDTTTDTIAVLGDYKLDLETDLGLLLGVTLQDGTTAVPLLRATKKQFDEAYADLAVTADRGYPGIYAVFAGQIYIGPIPDSIAYTYRLNYSQRAGTITSITAGIPFTDLYRDILMDLVLARLYKGLEEYEKAGFHREEFERGFAQATTRERRNKGASGGFQMRIADC